MRGRSGLLLVGFLPACAIVSGLSSLDETAAEVNDAAPVIDAGDAGDATVDGRGRDASNDGALDAPDEPGPPVCLGNEAFCDTFDTADAAVSPFGWTTASGGAAVDDPTAPSPPRVFRVTTKEGESKTGVGTFSTPSGFSKIVVEFDVRLGVSCGPSQSTLMEIDFQVTNGSESVRFGFVAQGTSGKPQYSLWESGFVNATPGAWDHVVVTRDVNVVTVTISGKDQGTATAPDPTNVAATKGSVSVGFPSLFNNAGACSGDVAFDNVRVLLTP